jgi:hypothetical protein
MNEEYSDDLTYRRFPRVPIERRIGAFAIDFVTIWFVSSFFGRGGSWIVFLIGWAIARIVVVDRNQGQTLGRYALDMKVMDYRYNRVPDLVTLAKREGIAGFAAMLASVGLQNLGNGGLALLFLVTPLLVDCLMALFDEDLDRAFHDRIAETIMIQTDRGYSLDLRLKKLLVTIQRNVRR